MPRPMAAAPVRALALVEVAAPLDVAAAAAVPVAVPELEGEVAVEAAAVPELVRVTPTLAQIAFEYASAVATS